MVIRQIFQSLGFNNIIMVVNFNLKLLLQIEGNPILDITYYNY